MGVRCKNKQTFLDCTCFIENYKIYTCNDYVYLNTDLLTSTAFASIKHYSQKYACPQQK